MQKHRRDRQRWHLGYEKALPKPWRAVGRSETRVFGPVYGSTATPPSPYLLKMEVPYLCFGQCSRPYLRAENQGRQRHRQRRRAGPSGRRLRLRSRDGLLKYGIPITDK